MAKSGGLAFDRQLYYENVRKGKEGDKRKKRGGMRGTGRKRKGFLQIWAIAL